VLQTGMGKAEDAEKTFALVRHAFENETSYLAAKAIMLDKAGLPSGDTLRGSCLPSRLAGRAG